MLRKLLTEYSAKDEVNNVLKVVSLRQNSTVPSSSRVSASTWIGPHMSIRTTHANKVLIDVRGQARKLVFRKFVLMMLTYGKNYAIEFLSKKDIKTGRQ